MPVERTVKLIVELADKFRSAGVFLLVSSEQKAGRCWNSVERLLTKDYVPTALMDLERAFLLPFPAEKPSIYVMQSAGMKDKPPLQELSAMSDIHMSVWLLLLEEGRSVDSFFSDVHLPFNCRFLVAHSKGDSIELMELYRITASHPLTVKHCGVWRDGHPIKCTGNMYSRRNNLKGLILRAVSMDNLPYSKLEKTNEGYTLSGSVGAVWNLLERSLKFNTEYQFPMERFSGLVLDNGSWNGLIGILARREADVAITGMIMTPKRTEVVDFTVPVFLSSYRLYIREPNTVDVDWGNFLAPFDPSLWLGILVVIFVVSVLLEASHQLIRHFGSCNAERQYRPFFQDSLFHVFSTFCSQGHDISYRTNSVRVLFLAAHITAVVLLSAYSAGLISSLTMENKYLPFSTFEELLNIGSYMAGVVNNSATIGLFSESKNQLLSEVYTKLMVADSNNFPATTLEGLQRVCIMTFTLVAQMSRVQNIRHNIPCKIMDLPATTIKVNIAIAFAKDSPYREVINYHLQRMRTAGILQKLQPPDSSKDIHTAVKSVMESVTLGDAVPLLAVWGASVLVGVTLLMLERKARWMMMRISHVTVQPNV